MLRKFGKWIGIAIAIVVTVVVVQFVQPSQAIAEDTDPVAALQAQVDALQKQVADLTKLVSQLVQMQSGSVQTADAGSSQPDTQNSGDNAGSECPQARDIGPFAPSHGAGEDFEITASDKGDQHESSAGVVLGLWWPSGQTPWGVKEVTTFIPRGLSVTVIDGAGRGWDYEAVCSEMDVQAQMDQHMADRQGDTNYHKFVSIDELVQLGIVNVRFDRRSSQASSSASADSSVNASSVTTDTVAQPAECKGTHTMDADKATTADKAIVVPTGHTYVVEAWAPVKGNFVYAEGMKIFGYKGAIWDYPCSADQAKASLQAENKTFTAK